jgi:hypothetical protein
VQRFATGPVILVLAAFAVYTFYAAIRAALTAEGYDPAFFWPSIALLFLMAAGAAWTSFRLYRYRTAKNRKPLTNA